MTGVLWYYLNSYVFELHICTVKDYLDKTVIEEILCGCPNISYYVGFHFYEDVKYYRSGYYPGNIENLEKWPFQFKDVGVSL